MILVFENTDSEEIKRNRPSIEGVSSNIVRFLGNHKKVQEWDFIEWDRKVALLVPKRYVILSRGRIWSICLLFKE